MQDFPEFIKSSANRVAETDRSDGVDGWVFDGADGSQVVCFRCERSGDSQEHVHDYDEYVTVLQGSFTLLIEGRETALGPGSEYLIPKGVPHAGRFTAGTRTIHAFGGRRARRDRA